LIRRLQGPGFDLLISSIGQIGHGTKKPLTMKENLGGEY
jgi:hypothetical protein